ncbi:MAG: SH3 domain-containing protein [Synergistaceae bacterium]|nr:SH3 domain-containing protein [Synergistaceae bacterium]
MNKIKIIRNFLIIIFVFISSAAFAIDFPTLGFCTGDGVRLRERPDTDSKIQGKVNDGDMLVLLGEIKASGSKWYKIDHPTKKGTAWIFGKYIETNTSYKTDTEAYKTLVQIIKNCGVTADKARAILGRPKRTNRRKFFFDPAQREFHEEVLEYSGFTLQYIEGRLRHVDAKNNFSFGDINIGDTTSEVLEVLGEPDGKGNEGWSYEATPRDVLLFEFRGGRVSNMTFDYYID